MAELSDEIFAELRKIDTPTITNVVATYPKNPLCLGLYNPWTENWYTDTSIRCIYPSMGAIVGHAVTCVYGLPDPNYSGRLSFMPPRCLEWVVTIAPCLASHPSLPRDVSLFG